MHFPNISAEQARAGKSNADLARELKVDPKTIYNWQSGIHPIPSTKLLEMCDLFGCTADYLLGRGHEQESA